MENVPHVTSGSGLRKFQADGFLFYRVYIIFRFFNSLVSLWKKVRKVIGLIVTVYTMKARKGSRGNVPLILGLGTRRKWVLNFTSWSFYPQRKKSLAHLNAGWTVEPGIVFWMVLKCIPAARNVSHSVVTVLTQLHSFLALALEESDYWTSRHGRFTPKEKIPCPLKCWLDHRAGHCTRWFKYDRDWFVCKQAALRSSCATLREWSHNLHPPSCSG